MTVNSTIRIRQASIDDLAVVVQLENSIFSGRDEIFTRSRLRYLLSTTKGSGFLCLYDNTPVGYGIALFQRLRNGKVKGRIYSLGVLEEYRGKKIGSALLSEMEKWLVTQGADFIMLETRADSLGARDFFKKAGYALAGNLPGYYDGKDGISMRKEIGWIAGQT